MTSIFWLFRWLRSLLGYRYVVINDAPHVHQKSGLMYTVQWDIGYGKNRRRGFRHCRTWYEAKAYAHMLRTGAK